MQRLRPAIPRTALTSAAALLVLLALLSPARAGQAKVIKKGGVRFYVKEKRIEVDGRFCLIAGPIEFLACARGGKEYESVISLDVNPQVLNFSLILMGLRPGKTGPRFQGDPDHAPTGSPVIVKVTWSDELAENVRTQAAAEKLLEGKAVKWAKTLGNNPGLVEWTNDGLHVARWDKKAARLTIWAHPSKEVPKERRSWTVRAEKLCWNAINKRTMQQTHWVFVGSKKQKDPDTGKVIFWANITKCIIAVFRDPSAILDLPLASGANDETYVVNKQLVPRAWNPCTVILTPAKLPAGK